ncbi:LacI family transcriptional regulator [Rhodobacter aestuarii]|uniref:Transcriptional regulator, LacI family n=1 Tax=Rhodobacter aestuarii TaxID=453582 RepID=A0A1N7JLH3_9RHOB|nr:LacI family DNA-binding transcriptional regulator [Rhodobacter aestuarii]PTV96084.1 LacI family transcriptional regulator [Rhodobacter aestuarii]SIS50222.1 transcriptional regulator, LacI family [Rhodobacter aestuarii]
MVGASPNIRDVARRAGVSTATVSRTLAQPDKVREDTRQKVMEAVEALGFVPNDRARVLRRQTSKTVILLVRDISNPFYLDIYKGVEEAAFAAGYKVLMGDARDDDERISHYIDAVRERHADGLILMIGRLPARFLEDPARLPPVVVASEAIQEMDLPTVKVDNVAAAQGAVEYLIASGHHRIIHLAGPVDDYLGTARLEGYRAALEAAGIAYDPGLVLSGDFSLVAGRDLIDGLLVRGAEFSAIFAASDQMAIGAITALRQHGLQVPKDVSVIGFDDTLIASMVDPALTTVHQPRRDIGFAAMQMMIARLNGTMTPPDQIFPTELVVRGSTRARPVDTPSP